MQEAWGSGGDDMNLGPSQWEDEEGGMWNNAASQESTSSCSSWGNAPKKGLQKVCTLSGGQGTLRHALSCTPHPQSAVGGRPAALSTLGSPREPVPEGVSPRRTVGFSGGHVGPLSRQRGCRDGRGGAGRSGSPAVRGAAPRISCPLPPQGRFRNSR